jgi:hypothetical protein
MIYTGSICVLAVVYNDLDYSTPGVRGFSGA